MVLLLVGKHEAKQYPEALPGEMLILRCGKYTMDLGEDVVFVNDLFDTPIINLSLVSTKALLNLHVDLERDSYIPLTLDRRGNFNRTDGISGSVNIRNFFSQDCKGGVK